VIGNSLILSDKDRGNPDYNEKANVKLMLNLTISIKFLINIDDYVIII
jgi:hypothetical protein